MEGRDIGSVMWVTEMGPIQMLVHKDIVDNEELFNNLTRTVSQFLKDYGVNLLGRANPQYEEFAKPPVRTMFDAFKQELSEEVGKQLAATASKGLPA